MFDLVKFVKIRPLMDGNDLAQKIKTLITVKIRPLMDGNILFLMNGSNRVTVKIRPLMDGNLTHYYRISFGGVKIRPLMDGNQKL